MQNQDKTLARARAHELFAELFTVGVSDSNSQYVKLIPELLPFLDEADLDYQDRMHESDHYEIFGKNIFPYESIFLDKEMNLGGEISESVTDFYQRIGYEPPTSENYDHIGVQLSALGYLSRLELELQEKQNSQELNYNREAQIELLDRHILQWMPMLNKALISQQNKFYSALCDLTLELLLEHRAILTENILDNTFEAHDGGLRLLEDSKTSLKDIAIYLLTPALSGVFISHSEISRIAKLHDLPRGFGNRVQMLTNLFRIAAGYDALPQVLAEIKGILNSWIDYYDRLADKYIVLRPIAENGSSKTKDSLRVISQVENAAQLESVD